MNNIDIDRINELYHKSKSVGLTKAEEAEQKKLRKAYLAAIRKNLRCRFSSSAEILRAMP